MGFLPCQAFVFFRGKSIKRYLQEKFGVFGEVDYIVTSAETDLTTNMKPSRTS
jgi:hypothetical protein